MALDFVHACDHFQMRLFVPMMLFGLRAAEPCFLFREYLDDNWLRVPCNPDLGYRTKGRRDKRFPLLVDLQVFWNELRQGNPHALLYQRRGVIEGRENPSWYTATLADLIGEFRNRCATSRTTSAPERQHLRDVLLHEAGALSYDLVEAEFASLARRLHWPGEATLKDLRHLFATTMNNASMPETYRRYLMGQSPGKAAVLAYTHLNELVRHYSEAVHREWQPLIDAILQRLEVLGKAC